MKQFLRRLCLRARYHRLVESGRRAMHDYMRATTALEMPFVHAEALIPSLVARRCHAARCAKRARRLRRFLGICPASSSY